MTDIKSNDSKEKVVKKVVTGNVKTKKKSDAQKLTNIFKPEDMERVKSYVISDVLGQGIKDIVFETIRAFMYPNGENKKSTNSTSKISYRKFYDDEPKARISRNNSNFDYDEIVFDNRGDAEATLDALDALIDMYGVASVGDLFDLADVSTDNYMTEKYGWTKLNSAKVVSVKEGWILKLPRALPIK